MSKKPFDKFINKKETGAKKKERIRQEKKQIRAEKNAYFEEQKRLKREGRTAVAGNERTSGSGRRLAIGDQRSAVGNQRSVGSNQQSATNRNQKSEARNQKSSSNSKSQTSNSKPEINPKSPISNQKSELSQMPLNKFIAWSGVCGRREAADLIKAGKVLVNGQIIVEPPHRVSQQDNIRVNGKKIALQKNLVYILLNKPKDYITTTDDPEGRKTVMDLIKKATDERVFPVGRLDRNTTGVMLLTNDGELAQRLTHPKYEVKKIYEVRVDQPVTKQQLDTIANGITLEDGFIQPDAVAYADAKDKSVIGIEIHSGRNRIVRRIFEHLGFKVKNLDRVMYGIFTKKNVDRGKWRFLSEKEIRLLKHLNTSIRNKKPQQQSAKK